MDSANRIGGVPVKNCCGFLFLIWQENGITEQFDWQADSFVDGGSNKIQQYCQGTSLRFVFRDTSDSVHTDLNLKTCVIAHRGLYLLRKIVTISWLSSFESHKYRAIFDFYRLLKSANWRPHSLVCVHIVFKVNLTSPHYLNWETFWGLLRQWKPIYPFDSQPHPLSPLMSFKFVSDVVTFTGTAVASGTRDLFPAGNVLCKSDRDNFSTSCSDITNTLVGISSETELDGGNRPIYFVYSGAICPVVVLNRSWCVTPHSSPTRGCWPCWPLQTILNILNIFTINIYIH